MSAGLTLVKWNLPHRYGQSLSNVHGPLAIGNNQESAQQPIGVIGIWTASRFKHE
jgi:hypothetical protein